jgi:hypothetical protein
MAARLRACLPLALLILTNRSAWAGPPLITDDPVPAAWRHWEIVTPVTLESASGDNVAGVPLLDVNYGGGRNLQLTGGAGVLWENPRGPETRLRLDGLELAAKWRFRTIGPENHQTQLAIFPRMIVPETDRWRSVGSALDWEVPLVWLQELDARTRLYGDLHVTWLHDSERNPVFAGLAWERDASEQWTLTGEFFWESAETVGDASVSGFQLGFIRALRRTKGDEQGGIDLLFAGGRSFSSAPNLTLYLGPRFTFRGHPWPGAKH